MLNPSDVYVSGGSNDLLVCWTDKVTKYDASSFYNFEQDNLPLHDLDERTELLWGKFGHPTSALTGMSFIVSADATDSCNPLYFTTLSACINALPEVINYPILVEVASFGDLGGLNISNKAFGPNGSLEVINRNSSFAGAMDIAGRGMAAQEYDGAATYKLASSVVPIQAVSAASGPSLAYDMQSAELFTTSSYISSATNRWTDDRYQDFNPYVFSKKVRGPQYNRLTASLNSTASPWPKSAASYLAAASAFQFTPFDKASNDAVYDVSTVNELTGGEIQWGIGTEDGSNETAAAAFAYFNKLDYIKINDCNGPVYVRNFNVDGEYAVDRGIEIKNSTVNLERCSVSRCNEAGLHCENSEVNLLRGFVGYRNYDKSTGTRVGTPFKDKREAYKTLSKYGAGIRAVNSTLNIKSTYNRDTEKSTTASAVNYTTYVGDIPAPSLEALYCLSRNDIGIDAIESRVIGGRIELGGSSTNSWNDATQVFAELNTEAGVKLENCVLNYSGRLFLDGNYFGLDSKNSKLYTDTLVARFNQSTGLKFENSELVYNKDLYAGENQADTDAVVTFLESQVAGIQNGQDIQCDNSIIKPYYTSSMPTIFTMVYTSGCFGKEDNSDKLLPSVHLKGNSDADFVHAHMVRVPSGKTTTAHYGLLTRVEDDSTLTVRGSASYANVLLGPTARNDSVNVAGLYANNNSNIKIQGPTTIGRFGVDVLAENNSNIEITPHQTNNGSLLVSSFNLTSPGNHTMVELHSTRACLVANRNSSILMENAGDYRNYYSGTYADSLSDPYDYTKGEYQTYASAGYIQFYPNANIDEAAVKASPANVASNNKYVFDDDGDDPASKYSLIHTLGNDVTGVTTGGMCVRAVENSLVQANNVHFPATWPNASGIIYDLEGESPLLGSNCTRLFIWNIADTSLLKASYLSVSADHPRDSIYNGPSGVWGNNVSGAPESTPDTSSLSILDYYGQNTVSELGKSASGENFGAFRLYFSTDPAANFLVASGANDLNGFARQVFAQGYNFSGNLVASSSDSYTASAQYTSLLKKDANNILHASGFYYASAMVASPNTVKAVLDDSALNTFANAKHNTVGKSGLAKVVEGYYATSAFGGDSFNDYNYGNGVASINNFDLKKDN